MVRRRDLLKQQQLQQSARALRAAEVSYAERERERMLAFTASMGMDTSRFEAAGDAEDGAPPLAPAANCSAGASRRWMPHR